MSMVLQWYSILKAWEDVREDLPKRVFKNLAFMTRYGRIGYEEAMRIPAWERSMYLESLSETIREEKPGPFQSEDD